MHSLRSSTPDFPVFAKLQELLAAIISVSYNIDLRYATTTKTIVDHLPTGIILRMLLK